MNFQPRRSFLIVADLLPPGVLIAIDFDGQHCLGAEEVEDVSSDRVLAAELELGAPVAQTAPQLGLRRRRLSARRASAADCGRAFTSPPISIHALPLGDSPLTPTLREAPRGAPPGGREKRAKEVLGA